MANPTAAPKVPVPAPGSDAGGVYSVSYHGWGGKDKGLDRMMDALASEKINYLVDTRNSDYRAVYSFKRLGEAAAEKGMKFASRPALTGKPKNEAEFTEDGKANYLEMDNRKDASQVLDGIAAAAERGDRIALLCACGDVCSCHRTRWLSESLERRGVDIGHIEPGDRLSLDQREEGEERELYKVTPHSELKLEHDLPPYSDKNWRESIEKYQNENYGAYKKVLAEADYKSPTPERDLPEHPTDILIAGSRDANNEQLNYTSRLVVRAAEIGAHIHVGDNDKGVDARVVDTCNSIGYDNVTVYTAGGDPRNGGVEGGDIVKVPRNPYQPGNAYTQRDRTMIRGLDEENGVAVFIDNGETHKKSGSLTGTEAGYVFAVEEEKAVKKVTFPHKQYQNTRLNPLPTSYTPKYTPEVEDDQPAPDEGEPAPGTATQPSRHFMTIQEFEENLRKQLGVEPEPEPAPIRELPEIDAKQEIPSTNLGKWELAQETSEDILKHQERLAGGYTARLGKDGADVVELISHPVNDVDGEPLGHSVSFVDAHWRASPFRIKTDDWTKADTVKVTTVAQFNDPESAADYKEQLQGYMDGNEIDDPKEQRVFLSEVGRLNGYNPGTFTTKLVDLGVGQRPHHRDEIRELQAGTWEEKTISVGFRPMRAVPGIDQEESIEEPVPMIDVPENTLTIFAARATTGDLNQEMGFSVAMDYKEPGLEPGQSQVMEVARFEDAGDAGHYAHRLQDYMQEQELPVQGEDVSKTVGFLSDLAERNGLAPVSNVQEAEHSLFNPVYVAPENAQVVPISSELYGRGAFDDAFPVLQEAGVQQKIGDEPEVVREHQLRVFAAPAIQMSAILNPDEESEVLGQSVGVALTGVTGEDKSLVMELARFGDKNEADQYVEQLQGFTQQENLALVGTPNEINDTVQFMSGVAEQNKLAPYFVLTDIEPEFVPVHPDNLDVEPMALSGVIEQAVPATPSMDLDF